MKSGRPNSKKKVFWKANFLLFFCLISFLFSSWIALWLFSFFVFSIAKWKFANENSILGCIFVNFEHNPQLPFWLNMKMNEITKKKKSNKILCQKYSTLIVSHENWWLILKMIDFISSVNLLVTQWGKMHIESDLLLFEYLLI